MRDSNTNHFGEEINFIEKQKNSCLRSLSSSDNTLLGLLVLVAHNVEVSLRRQLFVLAYDAVAKGNTQIDRKLDVAEGEFPVADFARSSINIRDKSHETAEPLPLTCCSELYSLPGL